MKRTFFFIFSALCLLNVSRATAQATIGSIDDPQSFSILELVGGGTLGFRLPQLTTFQRDDMVATTAFQAEKSGKARGLQIFNTISKCVETWNGTKWIQQCPPEGPIPTPVSPSPTSISCGITASNNNCTFTAIDTNAEWYEFFVGAQSQGIQNSNSITFDETVTTTTDVTVKYYYPLSFLKPKMIEVKGDKFKIGARLQNYTGASSGSFEATVADFMMSETEITQAQFEYVMGVNPSLFKCGNNDNNSYANKGNTTSALPVEMVNWYHAIAYCNKLSLLENKTPCYTVNNVNFDTLTYKGIPTSSEVNWYAAFCDSSKNGYRLPYEVEWEYAARGGLESQSKNGSSSYDYDYAGKNTLCDVGWYEDNNNTTGDCAKPCESVHGTKPVKQKLKNELDLYDMSGNVYEWCQDWYRSPYNYNEPHGPSYRPATNSHRVSRGGGWFYGNDDCRVSSRHSNGPLSRDTNIGFRVVYKGD